MATAIARKPWHYIPIDDLGYFDSAQLLNESDEKLRILIGKFERNRYSGPRNWQNLWRSTLGLDTTHGQRVLDYGCGFGIEALQFAKSGNKVEVTDCYPSNIALAQRVLRLCGFDIAPAGPVDVFYSNGCLHHTPDIRRVLADACKTLTDDGEIRLMLYSDRSWTGMTGELLPPISADVREHKAFPLFVEKMDPGVGEYADWYNREKLDMRVGDLLTIEQFHYIMQNGHYCTAILKPKG